MMTSCDVQSKTIVYRATFAQPGLTEIAMNNFFTSKAPFLLLSGLAAAFILYWHWQHVIDALPFIVVLSCLLMHFFMHHGHGSHHQHTEQSKNSEKTDV
jgi:hypothetical protein